MSAGFCLSLAQLLARRHTNRAVQPHVFAVEVSVATHFHRQRCIFFRATQTRRVRYLRAQRLLDVVRCTLHERRIEDTRQNRVDANQFPGQVSSNRQGHADDATLGRRVGSLPDLPIFRRHRCCIDDGATLAVDRVKGRHAGSRLRYASESTHQINLDDQVELIQREVADLTGFLVAADGLDRITGTRAVDKNALLTDCRTGLGEAGIYRVVIADIYIAEYTAEILREGFAFFFVEVKQGDFHAFFGQRTGGGGAKAADVRVDLKSPAYLPGAYVAEPEQKMDIYRRLARLSDETRVDRLGEEIQDRYGPLPPQVSNLLDLTRIRILAVQNGVEEVRAGRTGLSFFFTGGREPSPFIIHGLMGTGPRGLTFKAVDQLEMKVPVARDVAAAAAFSVLDLVDRLRIEESESFERSLADNNRLD